MTFKLTNPDFWKLGVSAGQGGKSIGDIMNKYGVEVGSIAHKNLEEGFTIGQQSV